MTPEELIAKIKQLTGEHYYRIYRESGILSVATEIEGKMSSKQTVGWCNLENYGIVLVMITEDDDLWERIL